MATTTNRRVRPSVKTWKEFWVSSAPSQAGNPDAGILAFERTCQTSEWSQSCQGPDVLVVINAHDNKASQTSSGDADMPVDFAPGTVLADEWTGGVDTFTVSPDGTLNVEVPPRGFRVLIPQGG